MREMMTYGDWNVNAKYVVDIIERNKKIAIGVVGQGGLKSQFNFRQEIERELRERGFKITRLDLENKIITKGRRSGQVATLTYINVRKPIMIFEHLDLIIVLPDVDIVKNKETLDMIEQYLKIDTKYGDMIKIFSCKNTDIATRDSINTLLPDVQRIIKENEELKEEIKRLEGIIQNNNIVLSVSIDAEEVERQADKIAEEIFEEFKERRRRCKSE